MNQGFMTSNRTDKKYNFLGIEIECLTYNDLFESISEGISNKDSISHHVAIINAYCATMAFKNPRVSKIYNSADLVGSDGMPFVYWLRRVVSEPKGRHPGLVTQNNLFNDRKLNTVIVAAITSILKFGELPGNVVLRKGEANLLKRSVVNMTQIKTVDKGSLKNKLAILSVEAPVWQGSKAMEDFG